MMKHLFMATSMALLLGTSAYAQTAAPVAPTTPVNPLRPVAPAVKAPAAAATPAAPAPTAAAPATKETTAEKPKRARSPAQLANDERMRKCGAEWRADTAALKAKGETWRTFSTSCRARLKAAGQ